MTVKHVWMVFMLGAAAAACTKDTGGTLTNPTPVAYLRYFNAVPDTGAVDFRVVDIVGYAPNQIQATFRSGGNPSGVATNFYPPYQAVQEGTRHIRVFLDGTTIATAGTILLDTTYTFTQGTYYTFYAYGYANAASGTPALKALITVDTMPTLAAGKIGVRVLNLAPDLTGNPVGSAATTINAQVGLATSAVPLPVTAGLPAVAANLGAGQLSGYAPIDNSDTTTPYRVALTAGGTTSPILFQAVMPLGIRGITSSNPIAGTAVAGTSITAVILPRSTPGSAAPQSAVTADTFPIDSLTRSNDTVTVWKHIVPGNGTTTCNTAQPAGPSVSNIVHMAGLTQPEYNGSQAVMSVTTGTSLTSYSQQTVTLSGATPGATWTLQVGSQTTLPIAFDATAGTVEALLGALSTVGPANVSVTGAGGGPYTILFMGSFAGTKVSAMTAAATAGSAAVAVIPVGCSLPLTTKQVVTLAGTAASDSFQLTFSGQKTAKISVGATAAQVQTALTALSTIGAKNDTVTGVAGGPYTVTFRAAFVSQNAATMTATVSGAGTITVAKQPFVFAGSATSSRFRYRIAGAPVSPATGTPSYKVVTPGNDYTAPTIIYLIDLQPPLTAP